MQRVLLAKYHVNDPVTFFSTSVSGTCRWTPNQPPAVISRRIHRRENIAKDDSQPSYQLISAMNRFCSVTIWPPTSAPVPIHDLQRPISCWRPGQVNGPKIGQQRDHHRSAVSRDLGVIGRIKNRIRWGKTCSRSRWPRGGLLYDRPVYASPGTQRRSSSTAAVGWR